MDDPLLSGPEHTALLSRIESPADAVAAMVRRLKTVGVEEVPLRAALGRVLARPIESDRPSPAADVSSVDGFAIPEAAEGSTTWPVSGESRAGHAPPPMMRGTAMKISTGAVVPPGTAVVAKIEDCDVQGDRVTVRVSLAPGTNIRRRGENAPCGTPVGRVGCPVTPALMAASALFGIARLEVHRRVRVAIVVTGDEITDSATSGENPLEPWQLRDSNGPGLRAMVESGAWAEVASVTRARDDAVATRSALHDAINSADLVLVTGGVSVGEHDLVPGALKDLNAGVIFHRLKQRPGQPALGAITPGGKAVLALPGNPLSVLVTARRLARPVAAHMSGLERAECNPLVHARGHDKPLHLWWHRSVRLTSAGEAEVCETKSSGDLTGAAAGDGFVEIPPGATTHGPWPFFGWEW